MASYVTTIMKEKGDIMTSELQSKLAAIKSLEEALEKSKQQQKREEDKFSE